MFLITVPQSPAQVQVRAPVQRAWIALRHRPRPDAEDRPVQQHPAGHRLQGQEEALGRGGQEALREAEAAVVLRGRGEDFTQNRHAEMHYVAN